MVERHPIKGSKRVKSSRLTKLDPEMVLYISTPRTKETTTWHRSVAHFVNICPIIISGTVLGAQASRICGTHMIKRRISQTKKELAG